MKTQHATFILQMIKHGDKLKAYQAAYPKAKGQSAIKAAERLLRQPEIASEIQTVMQDIRSKTIIETYKVMQQEQQVRILSVMKKREILNQIATCEMKVGRWIKDEGGYRMVYQDPRPRDIIHAIVTDTKLEEACNRMRDINDIKLFGYDIYIDGRPCDDPTAIPNPDIPTGLIMLPKKTKKHVLSPAGAVSASGMMVDSQIAQPTSNPLHPCDFAVKKYSCVSCNKKEQNISLSPAGGGGEEGAGGGSLAQDLISNKDCGNKKEQNISMSPAGGGGEEGAGGGPLVEDLISNKDCGNKKEQNISMSPAGGGGEERAGGGPFAQDLISKKDCGNKKEQNIIMSPAGAVSTSGVMVDSQTDQSTSDPLRLSASAVKNFSIFPLVGRVDEVYSLSIINEIEDHPDYLLLKKEYIAEKQQRTQNDPMSESFYKGFVRERDTPPHILTDEEVQAIGEVDKPKPKQEQPFIGKMYFPEKKYKDIL